MADIVAGDVTITLADPTRTHFPGAAQARHIVKIDFGDGALTYPTGGVPLPGHAAFGFVRDLKFLHLLDAGSASALVWKYDYANKKLRGWAGAAGVNVETSGAVAAVTLYAEAVGY